MHYPASRIAALLLIAFTAAPHAQAKHKPPPDHWVGTWAAAPVAQPNTGDAPLGSTDVTLREIVHVSLGGPRVRIILSNEFGTDPLTIGGVHIALSEAGSLATGGPSTGILLSSANALTFAGADSVTIPPGAVAVSDPANLTLPPLSDLTVSLFLPAQPIHQITQHGGAERTNFRSEGNVIGKKTLPDARTFSSWPFLKGVDVFEAGPSAVHSAAIVTFGDSITDGARITKDTNSRWPDVLAQRLQADKQTAGLGVLNEGISGNRLLHEGWGPSALARFDRDVLAQTGVKYVVLMESINDIGRPVDHPGEDVVTAQELIDGFTQLTERAHTHGIRVIGATLTPYAGAKYYSAQGETIRTAVNTWIRTSTILDGVIDFDQITRDPAHPDTYLPTYDCGDHLHPGDAGYKAMGEAIDLKLFYDK
jgi:lysophospholipase L1-like esterase